MKTLAIALCLLSLNALASDCLPQAVEGFKKTHPKFIIQEVRNQGVLRGGEEKPYLQGEIWNSGSIDLQVVEIKSSFMASFVHVALMDPGSCKMDNLIEVFFE